MSKQPLNERYEELKRKISDDNTLYELDELIRDFRLLVKDGFSEAQVELEKCQKRKTEKIDGVFAQQESLKKSKEKTKIWIAAGAAGAVLVVILIAMWPSVFRPMGIYNDAVALMEQGKYDEAIETFERIESYSDSPEMIKECYYQQGVEYQKNKKYDEAIKMFELVSGYKDSPVKIKECQRANSGIEYEKADALLQKGDKAGAAILFGKANNYKDAKERSAALWDEVAVRETISASKYHTVGLKKDGTVVALGSNYDGECNTSDFNDVIAVDAGENFTVALQKNGRVILVGKHYYFDGQKDAAETWTDIVAISANGNILVGLKNDGTVVAAGSPSRDGACEVSDWTDIVAVSAGVYHTVGLKNDGTVVAVGREGTSALDVSDWKDIVAISAGYGYTAGLKKDGTVVVTSDEYDVSGWKDIIAISAGDDHLIGLKKDGTVVSTEYTGSSYLYNGQCDVSDWTDIVAISAGGEHTVGLKKDGTVVAVGNDMYDRTGATKWKNIKKP